VRPEPPTSPRDSLRGDPVPKDANGLQEVNRHTEGHEFYGTTGTYYFLSRLRHQADVHSIPDGSATTSHQPNNGTASIVNALNSSLEYPTTRRGTPVPPHQQSSVAREANILSSGQHVERECARLYFQNLHNIHPVLNPSTFLSRCEQEIWGDSGRKANNQKFLSLFNIVIAIGAITAGAGSSILWQHVHEFLRQNEQVGLRKPTGYPPLQVAHLFFKKAKAFLGLGNIFETSSVETVQTLFLMVCHDARQRSCCSRCLISG
jgi:hypothetical protein